MKHLTLLLLTVLCLGFIGCDDKIDLTGQQFIYYHDDFSKAQIQIKGELYDKIITKLEQSPDTSERNVHMSLDSRKYLHVGLYEFEVIGHQLVLLDDFGVRMWHIKDIHTDLDAQMSDALMPFKDEK